MEVLVQHLTRRRSGAVVSRDEELSCEHLRFGRGTGNEVELTDHRVLLQECALHLRPGGLFLETMPQSTVLMDGKVAASAPVKPGTILGIGPYEVVVAEPPEGKDLAVTVELVREADDTLAMLKARSTTTLAAAGMGRRRASWGLSLLVLALFLVWPVAQFFSDPPGDTTARTPVQDMPAAHRLWPVKADLAWNSGEISGPHKFIAEDCSACHKKPFEQVTDTACVACHTTIEHHVDPVKFAGLHAVTTASCQSCHKEHRGPQHIVRQDQAFCADCHDDLKSQAPDTVLLNAGDFGSDHPEFHPSVVVDGETGERERLALDAANWPVERSNLRFPHDTHLKPEGIRFPGEEAFKVLQCADCHVADAGGIGLRPIDMERNCASCHQLRFEPDAPNRFLPHGDLDAALMTIREFYSDLALRGGAEAPDAPSSFRRMPGQPMTREERLAALAWADQRAEQAAAYAARSVCGVCHEMSQTVTAEQVNWQIKKVTLADRWMPKGLFDHGQHETMECGACHAASTSHQATDVLLPQIASCQTCHGGEKATNKVPTGCIQCHGFHFESLPPMRPETPAPARSANAGTGTPDGRTAN